MSEFNVEIAIKHRDQYYLYMSTGASGLCYAIEQFYGLDGYPPSLVSIGLNAACEGKCPHEVIDREIDGEE